MARQVLITKEDGTQEYFSPEKLQMSLSRAGAPQDMVAHIIAHVVGEITTGDSTQSIYRHAFALLRKHARPAAARYSMKRAVLQLGPSGFPFEKFLAEIFTALGYRTKTGVILRGKCVEHEIDVVAEGNGKRIGVEAKFHNNLGLKSDVKVSLYVKARFDDLRESARREKFDEVWLVTNTKFTSQATAYGKCVGLTLVSWDYPRRGNLNDLIEEAGVHPITCLTTLGNREKLTLLSQNIVLCRDIMRGRATLVSLGLSETKIAQVLAEAHSLCTSAS
jgi:hypothetical protein